VLFVISVFGAAVRVPIAFHSGLWRDEALFLGVVGQSTVRDVLGFLSRHESHPPLFYLMARVWTAAFGPGDHSVAWLATIFGVGLIPLCWWVGRRFFGRGAALIAAGLVSSSQLLAVYGASVRPYAFLACLAVLVTYFLWRALLEYEPRRWIPVATATLAMVYTHNWAWLVVGAHGLLGLTWIAFTRTRWRSRVAALGTAYLAVLIGFLPWMRVLLYQTAHAGYPAAGSLLWVGVWQSAYVLLGIVPAVAVMLLALPVVLLLWGWHRGPVRTLGSRAMPAPEGRRLGVLLATGTALVPLVVAVAVSPVVNLLKPQGFTIVAPCLALAVAVMPSMAHAPWRRVISGASLGVYIAMCVAVSTRAASAHKSNAREVALLVQQRARPGDIVIQFPGFITSSFNRYFHGDQTQIAYPRFGGSVLVEFDRAYQRGTGFAQLRQTLDSLDSARAAGRGVWFLYDEDVRLFGAEPPPDSVGTSEYYYRMRHDFAVRLWSELARRFGEPEYQTSAPGEIAFEGIGVAYFRAAARSASSESARESASPAAQASNQ
jgi:hypothetical protein